MDLTKSPQPGSGDREAAATVLKIGAHSKEERCERTDGC
jgi:hypothetical protein